MQQFGRITTAALTLLLLACGSREQQTTEQASKVPPLENSVQVRLTEYEIEMPAALPAGPTTFHVGNAGTIEHSFEIEGQGVQKKLDSPLQPGRKADLQIELKPGTYRVYCPIAGHAEKDMSRELTVTS